MIPHDPCDPRDKQKPGPAIPTWAPSTAGPQPQPPLSPGACLAGVEMGGRSREVTTGG